MRDAQQWVVIGRDNGRFVDNAKHLFCWMHSHAPSNYTITFVSEDEWTVQQLRRHNAASERYPSPAARKLLLRAGTVIVDNNHPFRRGYLDWIRGARLVQLWHGAPLKQIELYFFYSRISRLSPLKQCLAKMQMSLTSAYPEVDVLVSTSKFFTHHAFKNRFHAGRIIETGYPRNDCFGRTDVPTSCLLNVNVDQAARQRMVDHRRAGGRVILYAPTYRDDLRSPFDDGGIDLAAWARSAKRDDILLVLKLHPEMLGKIPSIRGKTIVQVAPDSDIYPLLPEVDLLVGDYSSIQFDYLLLDRPIVFFPYDLDRYVAESRSLIFDYDSMTPGPKAYDFAELLATIRTALETHGGDVWRAERERVKRLVFDHVDGSASERIWTELTRLEAGKT